MDVLLHDVAQEGRRHAKEEDGEAECPFRGALGEADVVSDFLAEDGPAVDRTDAAMEEQCRDGGIDPFVLFAFHDMIYLVSFYVFYSAIIICDVQPPIILLAISLKCKTILVQKRCKKGRKMRKERRGEGGGERQGLERRKGRGGHCILRGFVT